MPVNIEAGSPWTQRPALTLLNEVNTYPTSLISAPLFTLDGGPVEEIPALEPGEEARALFVHLFMADVPVISGLLFAVAVGGAVQIPGAAYSQGYVNAPLTTTNAPVGALEFISSPSVDETIPAFCTVFFVDGGPYLDDDAAVARPAVYAISNAGVNYGPALGSTDATADPDAPDFVPVILLDTDYTQAMRDAGNVYTIPGGPTIAIVGLWSLRITLTPVP